MNEFKDPFDQSEIDKIQREIDRDLENGTNESISVPENLNNDLASTENVDSPAIEGYGKREVVPSDDENKDYVPSQNIDDQSFFKETIKNETHKNKVSGFKRLIAVVCIISILGGSSVGAMMALTTEVIIPMFSKAGNKAPVQEFKFAESTQNEETKTQGSEASYSASLKGGLSFADLIDSVEPSVVCITSVKEGAIDYGMFSMQGETPNQGSGIIFDEDNERVYIVSNNHVTSGAKSVLVSISGAENVPATLVGKEPQSDLVVLSVLKKDLKEKGVEKIIKAKFGSSKNMRVGDFAIAIGNALGEGNTATFGFISAIDKEVSVEDRVLTVIQTDAAINPGNSGGPLINLNGEVIGINTLKLAETKVEGMGYCITSDVAMPIIEQLRNRVPKPMLGIVGYTVTPQVAQAFNLPEMGVVVESVLEGSSAAKAGIQRTDIITSFKGETVFDMDQLSERVQSCEVGEEVELKLIREGKETLTLTVTLSENKDANF